MKRLKTSLRILFFTLIMLGLTPNLYSVNASSKPSPSFTNVNQAGKPRQVHSLLNYMGDRGAGVSKKVNEPNNAGVKNLTGDPSGTPPLVYDGGETMHTSKTYLIFWEPSHLSDGTASGTVDSTYNSTIEQYYQDIASVSTGLYGTTTQYYDNTNGHIANSPTYGAAYVDTTSYPSSGCTDSSTPHGCLSETQIETEIKNIVSSNSLTPNMNTDFIVFTTNGEGTSFTNSGGATAYAYSPYCGYHDAFSYSSNNYIFAQVPYSGTNVGITSPCNFLGNDGFTTATSTVTDSAISSSSHEHFEMITDPDPEARLGIGVAWWSYDHTSEIGDLCDQVVPNPLPKDSGKADVQINGHYYVVQDEWSNFINDGGGYVGCTLSSSGQPLTQTIYSEVGSNLMAYSASDGGIANNAPRWQPYSCGSLCTVATRPAFDSLNGYVYIIASDTSVKLEQIKAVNGTNTGVQFPSNGNNIGNVIADNYLLSPPMNNNGIVYVSTKGGPTGTQGIYAFKSNGGIEWKNVSTSLPALSLFAWGNNTLYAIDDTTAATVYAFSTQSGSYGTEKWSYTIPSGSLKTADMTLSNGVLYFGTEDTSGDTLYALQDNGTSSSVNWTQGFAHGSLFYSPALDSTGAYLTAYDSTSGKDYLYGFSLSGSSLWTPVQLNYGSQSKVVISGTTLYVAENGIESINEGTGAINWQSASSANYYTQPIPVVLDAELFVDGGNTNKVDVYNTGTSHQGEVKFSSEGSSFGFILPATNSF